MKSTFAPVTRFDSSTKGYCGYALALLTLVFVVNFIDRQVLSAVARGDAWGLRCQAACNGRCIDFVC